jgi:hypothetical protein
LSLLSHTLLINLLGVWFFCSYARVNIVMQVADVLVASGSIYIFPGAIHLMVGKSPIQQTYMLISPAPHGSIATDPFLLSSSQCAFWKLICRITVVVWRVDNVICFLSWRVTPGNVSVAVLSSLCFSIFLSEKPCSF